ncbi:hypothetical protein MH212_16320, partial [Bacillus safensis]|nr:hypothetical protein [Bacillus safensis]
SITLKRRQRAKIKIILALCQQSESPRDEGFFYERFLLYSQSAVKKTKRPAMRMTKVTGGLLPWKYMYSACPPNARR